MVSSTRLTPALKAFMTQVLPGDKGGYIWALGSDHRQTIHSRFLRENLDELKREHNLGTVGYEGPPYLDVALWAYRDRKLPVPPKHAHAYVKSLLTASLTKPEFRDATHYMAETIIDTVDRGTDVCHFDARSFLASDEPAMEAFFKNALKALYRKYPGLQFQTRTKPDGVEALGALMFKTLHAQQPARFPNADEMKATVRMAAALSYVSSEIHELLKKTPIYAQRLSDIEAVMEAGKRFHMGEDAMSALVFAMRRDPEKNAISNSGYNHLIGAANDARQAQGTFSQHLAHMGLPVETSMFIDREDIPFIHGELPLVFEFLKAAGAPKFALPKMIFMGPPEGREAFVTSYRNAQSAYAKTPTPPERFGKAYLEKMQAAMEQPDMVSRLERLRASSQQQRQEKGGR